ncbi:MAG: hypothetical protein HYU56_04295 [Candidatus Aenigmarchaeota archaeon]|nr:hypothetical protein [Candidatus Aenigmarchaeota archaeon]
MPQLKSVFDSDANAHLCTNRTCSCLLACRACRQCAGKISSRASKFVAMGTTESPATEISVAPLVAEKIKNVAS